MSTDEAAIRQLIATWLDATQRGDTATVLSLMTDDVVFLVAGQPPFGKEAFAAASQAMSGVSFAGTSEIEELEIHGDWAWLRNRLRVVITPPGGQPVARSGYTLTILRKQAGHWLLARDANLLTAETDSPKKTTGTS
jgi:uncharacterized protein (TIGR02246 family)